MKRLALALAATIALTTPLAAGVAYADPPGHNDHDRGRDHGDRWDRNQHNGYTYNGQWHYGPPPSSYYGRPGYQPGYHAWGRGDRLPSYYRSHYVVVDYRHEHLRRPPHGYHWVRDDRGEYLLVGIATGLIADLLINH
ncbi:MAG: RcnB family protein [Alphaproteobacteria bacterium]